MDNLITCNRCGGNACYVKEVSEGVKTYQCYGCGFTTNTLMKRESEFIEAQEKEKYPIPGEEGEYYKWRMDMDTLKDYDELDYMDALEYIGIFKNEENDN